MKADQDPMADQKPEQILGIDIGGNHVKMGLVDTAGHITEFQSYATADWRETHDFVRRLRETIAFKLIAHKDVRKIGIGLPGMISKDRRTPLEITAIPELNDYQLWQELHEAFPTTRIELENDANAAALGEFYFSKELMPTNFLFITLGTGIGSAAVIEGKIFTGGDGNGLELGHILSRHGRKLEQNIGKQGVLNLGAERLAEYRMDTVIPRDEPISATRMVISAEQGDDFSRQIFDEVGEILGEGLVACVRIMDIKAIVIGGGLSASFDYIKPAILRVLEKELTPYYTSKLSISRATLGNDAGLLGAASLCMSSLTSA